MQTCDRVYQEGGLEAWLGSAELVYLTTDLIRSTLAATIAEVALLSGVLYVSRVVRRHSVKKLIGR